MHSEILENPQRNMDRHFGWYLERKPWKAPLLIQCKHVSLYKRTKLGNFDQRSIHLQRPHFRHGLNDSFPLSCFHPLVFAHRFCFFETINKTISKKFGFHTFSGIWTVLDLFFGGITLFLPTKNQKNKENPSVLRCLNSGRKRCLNSKSLPQGQLRER